MIHIRQFSKYKLSMVRSPISLLIIACLWFAAQAAADPAIQNENPSEHSADTDTTQSQQSSVDRADQAVEASAHSHLSASELKTYLRPRELSLRSSAVLVVDERDDVALYERNASTQRPIASLTKLMSAMVLLDADLPLDEAVMITRDDHDRLRRSRSRLRFGTVLSRADMLLLALAASENRAASALARTFPGGKDAFVIAMNSKAKDLGLLKTKFVDPTGLHSENVSTAEDLATMIEAAYQYPLIRQLSTIEEGELNDTYTGRSVKFVNTNRLIRSDHWDIDLSKTGFISEAGFCLVMRTSVGDRPLTIILLNSWGKMSKYGDANRIKNWLIKTEEKVLKMKNNLASTGATGAF